MTQKHGVTEWEGGREGGGKEGRKQWDKAPRTKSEKQQMDGRDLQKLQIPE